ncbi:maleylacetate reductase [Streptomyces sp. NBC_01334]|uniref:maleylacetate reductase n=1 Tax=Streptomyces sp. NBC_01334 TaxID=2903827 RepID=UPI002E0D5629|nr:maleylacetate reductase [Streptomyces sp. NBC_01334]
MTSHDTFTFQAAPTRVVFGAGRVRELADETQRLGLRRILVIASRRRAAEAETVADLLDGAAVAIHAEGEVHVPSRVAQRAVSRALEERADGCVAIGGGSAIGLAKAVALSTSLPFVAVPTTYSGSEMTPIWGMTGSDGKVTGRDPRVLPRTVVYDPALTTKLPAQVSVTSGLNAVAHAAEALYAHDASPVSSMMAVEGVRALWQALPEVVADGADLSHRTRALYGAWLSGACLGATTMGLHHKLCHILGGLFDLPHSETHTVLLPHVLAYNLPAAPRAALALGDALGTSDVPRTIFDMAERLGVPTSLKQLGLPTGGVEMVVERAMALSVTHPRPVSAEAVRTIMHSALVGATPG